jgi:hypothetical protein
MPETGWRRRFDDPIPLSDGGELRTLLDAGRYVDALPRSKHEREEWQAVTEVLLSAVEGREPVSLLRIALCWPYTKAARRKGHGAAERRSRLAHAVPATRRMDRCRRLAERVIAEPRNARADTTSST